MPPVLSAIRSDRAQAERVALVASGPGQRALGGGEVGARIGRGRARPLDPDAEDDVAGRGQGRLAGADPQAGDHGVVDGARRLPARRGHAGLARGRAGEADRPGDVPDPGAVGLAGQVGADRGGPDRGVVAAGRAPGRRGPAGDRQGDRDDGDGGGGGARAERSGAARPSRDGTPRCARVRPRAARDRRFPAPAAGCLIRWWGTTRSSSSTCSTTSARAAPSPCRAATRSSRSPTGPRAASTWSWRPRTGTRRTTAASPPTTPASSPTT